MRETELDELDELVSDTDELDELEVVLDTDEEDVLDDEELELDELEVVSDTEVLDEEDELLLEELEDVDDELELEVDVEVVSTPAIPVSHPYTVAVPPVADVVIRRMLSTVSEGRGTAYGMTTVWFAAIESLQILLSSSSVSSKSVTVQAPEALTSIVETMNRFPDCGVQTSSAVTALDHV